MFTTEDEDNDDDDDDDDDEEEEEEERRPTGHNLRLLWGLAGGRAARSAYKGGRNRKSGRKMIRDAAAAIRRLATTRPHPRAQAMGRGPCLIAAGGTVESRGRPTHSFTGRIGANGTTKQFQAPAYHVAWCDANDQPPPAQVGLTYSHLCNEKRCVEPQHGVWEDNATNASRERCRAGAACGHQPACFV